MMNAPPAPASWVYPLVNSLSDDDWRSLKNPGEVGTATRNNVARIIQRLVEKGAREVNKLRSTKPGPKPRDKYNQTDNDIATLWSCIRMILDLPGRTTISSISTKASTVLHHARSFMENHLLLTTEESNIVHFHLTSWGPLCVKSDFSKECERLPKRIEDMNPEVSLKCWAGSTVPQEKIEYTQASRSRRTQRLDVAYVKFVRLMDLHKAPLLNDERVTIYTDAHDDEWRHLEFHEFNSLQELRLKKKDILWSVIGRLSHLKTILHQASFVWTPVDADNLLFQIEIADRPIRRSRAKSEINPVLARLGALKRIIITASLRQGISPFTPFLSELGRPFPSPVPPGQMFTGLGDRSVSGDGHASSKTPPVGKKKRQKSRDK